MLANTFADLAAGFAAQFGAPFQDVVATWQGVATKDAGGSITAPGVPFTYACKAQFDAASHSMRQSEGFLETDVRIIVLAATLAPVLDSKAQISVLGGQYAGTWALLSVTRDPAGIGYECRGRKLSGAAVHMPLSEMVTGNITDALTIESGQLRVYIDELPDA